MQVTFSSTVGLYVVDIYFYVSLIYFILISEGRTVYLFPPTMCAPSDKRCLRASMDAGVEWPGHFTQKTRRIPPTAMS